MQRGWVCLLSSQRDGLCQLLSYSLPAPAPAFHTQLPDASWEHHISPLPVGPLLGLPPGDTRRRLQSWGSKGSLLLGACFLGLWFLRSPCNIPSPGQEQFLPVQHLNQVCCFPSTYRPILITPPSETMVSCPVPTPQRSWFQLCGHPLQASKIL